MLNIVEMGIEQPCMAKPNSEIVSVLFIIHLFNALCICSSDLQVIYHKGPTKCLCKNNLKYFYFYLLFSKSHICR